MTIYIELVLLKDNLLLHFRLATTQPHEFQAEAAKWATRAREVDLSRLKGFHLRFTPKVRSGVTGNWSDDIWKLNGGKYRFHSDQNNRMCVRFSCSVIKWLQTNILNENWWYRVAKTRPKLFWILNWSPETRYIIYPVANVHFWQTFWAEMVPKKTKPGKASNHRGSIEAKKGRTRSVNSKCTGEETRNNKRLFVECDDPLQPPALYSMTFVVEKAF